MFSFWTWVGIVILVLVVIFFLNRTAFRRMYDAGSAQVGKVGRSMWGFDPIAVKNAEIDRKAEELAEANQGLVGAQAQINEMERLVEAAQKESNRLGKVAEQYVKEGNDARALDILSSKERIDKELEENKLLLERSRTGFNAHKRNAQAASRRIADLRRDAQRQGQRLQMSKAEANLARLNSTLGGTSLNFDSLSEVDEEIERQIDHNRARGQVASDLAAERIEELAVEDRARTASAADKLAEMKEKLNKK